MKRKLTPFDYALWAALPMAHTSKIEGRLTLILDKTRRRTLPRRTLFLALAVGGAVLVPLAMLRPVADAQTAPAVTGPVQLIWVADASALSGPAWDQTGNVLHTPVFQPLMQSAETKISAPAGQKAVSVAFRIPAALQQSSRIVVNGSNAPLGHVILTTFKNSGINAQLTTSSLQTQSHGGPVIYTVGLPTALTSADFQVCVTTNTGTETIDCQKTVGKVRLHRPAGDVIFTLFPHPQSGAVFMVSDHFRRPSPLKADNLLQAALHDGENYERSVYAQDASGKVFAKLILTPNTWPDAPGTVTQDYRSIKTQQTGHLSSFLLRHTASFRLVARPYQWTEFKNVALQPTLNTSSTAISASAQNYQTPWTSQVTRSRWQPHATYHLAIHVAPRVEGTRPDLPVTGQLVYGSGKVGSLTVVKWKPGKSDILTVKFDYTPAVSDKAHPDIVHLLTKQGAVASVLEFHSV